MCLYARQTFNSLECCTEIIQLQQLRYLLLQCQLLRLLLNALYAQRKRLAGKQNVPAFMVFSDATLREMVEKKPLSLDELLNISGVGEKKAARYGNAFLRVIEDAVGSRE